MSPAEYAKQHQKAFRSAFDFLTAHFPPGMDSEWWDQAWADLVAASKSNGENKLVIGILVAVYDYLESEYKKRRNNDGRTED